MWKNSISVVFASVFLLFVALQDCASALGVPFHGYIPLSYVKGSAPEADERPNDVYSHLPVRRRQLAKDELVIYPLFFGFEQGKDSEHKVYNIFMVKDLITNRMSKQRYGHGNNSYS